MMPPQHDNIGGSNQHHRHGGDGGSSSNDGSNHDNIWSKIEAERRRQSNIRSKLQSGSNREIGGNGSNEFLPPPKTRASYPSSVGIAVPVTPNSSLPPLPRSISTPGEASPSKSNRSRSRRHRSESKHRERRSSSSGYGSSGGSGSDGGGGVDVRSSSHHSRKKKKNQTSVSYSPKPSRSKSEPFASLKSTTTADSTTMWVPHLYPSRDDQKPVEVKANYDSLNRRYSSQYSQDSEILNSNRSTPVNSRHSRKSTSTKDGRQDSDGTSIDSGSGGADGGEGGGAGAGAEGGEGGGHSKRSERRRYRSNKTSDSSKARSKSACSPVANDQQEPSKTKSSDHTLDTRPSSFASTIFTQPNSFAEGSTNTYPQSPGPGQPSSFASDNYFESPGPGTQPSSFASFQSLITPGNDSTKPPSSKSNSMASSGRMSYGSGRLSSSAGGSQKSLPPPIPPERRRKSTKKKEEYQQQQQPNQRDNADDRNEKPPLPLVSSEWCIDSKPSSFLQPPDTRLRNAPTPQASDDDDSKSFDLEEYAKDISTANNNSARSDRSHSMHASQKITWDTKRVIAKEDVKRPEGWVYCMACIILVVTIGGIGGCVLFVFGAWDVDGSELYGQVQSQVEYLSTNSSVFDDPNSPQSLALNWIVYDDESNYDITTDTIRREQRYSLAVLYYSTNGPTRWTNNLDFLSPDNECQWNSNITVNSYDDTGSAAETTSPMSVIVGTTCAEDSQTIAKVRIFQNDLQGTVPVELSALSSLKDLTLNNNDLSGTLPDGINIETLERFDLSNNNIQGIIPEPLNLVGLRVLDLTMNQLSSSIPMTTLDQLSNLETLRLGHNQFSGSIGGDTESLVMSNLLELNLTSNSLEGSIDFLSRFNSLQALDISMNQFFGTVPIGGDSLNKLQTFVFSDNSIQGSLPNSIAAMTDLVILVGSRNSLSGTFPWAAITNNDTTTSNSQLQRIDLEDNSLIGSLPSNIGLHPNLELVNFGSNQLSGSIPNAIGSLKLLNSLKLSLNNLSGQLPINIGSMQNIVLMDVSGNSLEGNIPASFGELKSLQDLELDSNSLTGNVPAELASIPELETLNLHDNALTGSLEFFCKGDSESIPQISADCAGDSPEISCSCCAVCL